MSDNILGLIGVIVTGLGYIMVFYVAIKRAGHQNISEDAAAMKASNEVADLAVQARLRAEKELAEKDVEYGTLQTKYEALQQRLAGLTYKACLEIHEGAVPIIEVVSVERVESSYTK